MVSFVAFLSDLTTGSPIVIFGTKCPSITSTCRTLAPPASTAAISSASFVKSAERIDGAISNIDQFASSLLRSGYFRLHSASRLWPRFSARFCSRRALRLRRRHGRRILFLGRVFLVGVIRLRIGYFFGISRSIRTCFVRDHVSRSVSLFLVCI